MTTNRSRHAMVRGGALTAVAGLLVLVACEAKIPTAQDLSSMDVAAVEKAVAEGSASKTRTAVVTPPPKADYFVDGVQKSKDEANALASTSIASVDVVKGARDTILITTVKAAKLHDSLGLMKVRVAGQVYTDTLSPEQMRGLPRRSSNPAERAALTIDGVPSSWSRLDAIKGEDIASISVSKPGAQSLNGQYPNGLVAVTLHTAATRAGSMKERKP